MSIAYAGSVGFFGSGERNRPEKLLERFENSQFAYSLRNLNGDPKFNVVRVRRSAGDEQDFTASQLTDGTLASFCDGSVFFFDGNFSRFSPTWNDGDEVGYYESSADGLTWTQQGNTSWFFKNEGGTGWYLQYIDSGTGNVYRMSSTDGSSTYPYQVDWFNTSSVTISTYAHGSPYGSNVNFFNGDGSNFYSFQFGNDGFVRTWYDQSGKGYHANQTSSANQPQIVSGGSYLGLIRFDSGSDALNISFSPLQSSVTKQTFYYVAEPKSNAAGFNVIFANILYTPASYFSNQGTQINFLNPQTLLSNISFGDMNTYSVEVNVGGTSNLYVNNTLSHSISGMADSAFYYFSDFFIGNGAALNLSSVFDMKEFIQFNDAATDYRETIRKSIVSHYGTPS
jgi:hypothetical protein